MKLSFIAGIIGSELPLGALDCDITKIADPQECDASSITFVSNPKYSAAAAACPAAAVIVKSGALIEGKCCLLVKDPYLGYARVAQLFEDTRPLFEQSRHPSAIIDSTAVIAADAMIGPGAIIGAACQIGSKTIIGAGCVVENRAQIGSNTYIHSKAVICRDVIIGNSVIVESGAVIGSEGFGNAQDAGQFVRIPSFGTVIIHDEAWIGANTTIDRGALGPTVIGRGVRIDNQVQIAHNVQVGDHSAIAAQAGISGSTKVGKRVIIAGQAGFVGHIEIGDDSFVGAKSGVSKDVEPGSKVTGYPARDFMTMRRIEASSLQLPEIIKDVKKMKAEIIKLTDGQNQKV